LILPITLGSVLLAAYNKKIMGDDYQHPLWLTIFGAIAVAVTVYGGYISLEPLAKFFS